MEMQGEISLPPLLFLHALWVCPWEFCCAWACFSGLKIWVSDQTFLIYILRGTILLLYDSLLFVQFFMAITLHLHQTPARCWIRSSFRKNQTVFQTNHDDFSDPICCISFNCIDGSVRTNSNKMGKLSLLAFNCRTFRLSNWFNYYVYTSLHRAFSKI
jgi:hypothetical protein